MGALLQVYWMTSLQLYYLLFFTLSVVGGAMASSLVHLFPDQAAWVQSLARTLRYVLGQDTLPSQCLSTFLQLYGLASNEGGSRSTPSRFMLKKPG